MDLQDLKDLQASAGIREMNSNGFWKPTSDGSPIMGSGSLLGRKTLVYFPDVFLTSPQSLHRAFPLSNKVNKCQ